MITTISSILAIKGGHTALCMPDLHSNMTNMHVINRHKGGKIALPLQKGAQYRSFPIHSTAPVNII